MYFAIILVLLGLSVLLVYRGMASGRRSLVATGVGVALVTAATFALLTILVEVWWYEALGYAGRLWTAVGWQAGSAAAGAVIGGGLLYLLTLPMRSPAVQTWPEFIGALVGAMLGGTAWDEWALWLHSEPVGTADPLYGLDLAVYLFTVPALERLYELLVWLAVVGLGAAVAEQAAAQRTGGAARGWLPLTVYVAALAILSQGMFLLRLLTSDYGVVSGPGWTDVHVRLPVALVLAVLLPLVLLLPLTRAWRARSMAWMRRRGVDASWPEALGVATSWALALVVVATGHVLLPGLAQWLLVQPNELARETPYLLRNIAWTRQAFDLSDIEFHLFPAEELLDPAEVAAHEDILREIRLWDPLALDAVYAQFQEFRLYYEFVDVDVDRYRFGNRYRQVMISARELARENLPPQSRTFVNHVFKYTHGYGLTLAPVHEFTVEGLPQLLVRDIPPQSAFPELQVERPEIYYGELGHPVVVNSATPEFDHPSGGENVTTRYQGRGGIQLGGLLGRLAFGWTHFGTRFVFSSYPTPDSRVMIRRTVRDRVHRVAPFLHLDADPYLVLAEGRLFWILDGYTLSSQFPYSERYDPQEVIRTVFAGTDGAAQRGFVTTTLPEMAGANYVRNSVKAVVDAYEGTVRLYVFEPDDPLIRAWSRVFDDLLRPATEMPASLMTHVRYPEDYLLIQGRTHAKYHMTDPEVFYNQEDLWVRATEQHYGQVRPIDPYYVMWRPPGEAEPQFTLILPFTPRNRQVAIGWIAGLSDGGDYGRLLAYQFPKDRLVVGPQQVETKIDQDPQLSAQLALWDQRGSRVLRGNVLAIPIGNTLMYVEPIYLRAETAAYPELRLVIVMIGERMAYAPRFDEALAQLVTPSPALATGVAPPPAAPGAPVDLRELGAQADRLFREYLRLQGEGRFEEAGRTLDRLSDVLQQLSGQPIPEG